MKYLSYEGLQYLYGKILTRLGLKVDATGGDISETVIETLDTVEDKYPIPAAGESVKRFFGKVLTFLRNIRPLTGNINIYVSTTGSDTTGDGTSVKPFKTIQFAIDCIPKDLGGRAVIITVGNGTYPESVKITGFTNGEFRLYSSNTELLSDNCKINRIVAQFNTCLLVVAGFSITTTTDDGIIAESCTSLNFQFMKITENAISSGKIGMSFYRCCTFSVWNCQVSYHNVALFAYNSKGVSNMWATCVGNNYGLYSSYGSVITITGAQPAATTNAIKDAAGSYIFDNGTQINGLPTAGLACAWGTITGGYWRIGGQSGTAQIVVTIAVTLTTSLSASQQYQITGFPIAAASTAVTVHAPNYFNFIQLFDNRISINPAIDLPVGGVYLLSCTYMTNL